MVKQAFGAAGGNIGIGAKIVARAALPAAFAYAAAKRLDDDACWFAQPRAVALGPRKSPRVAASIEALLRDRARTTDSTRLEPGEDRS